MRIMIKSVFLAAILLSVVVNAAEPELLDFGSYVGRIYGDGSGSIGTPEDIENWDDIWSFRIKTDEMTDEKIVTVERWAYNDTEEFGKIKLKTEIYLWINFSDNDREVLCVGGHDYPGETAMIRIDSNDPIETNENGCLLLDNELNQQLIGGSVITIRGATWPYRAPDTQKINLGGYLAMSDFLRSERSK